MAMSSSGSQVHEEKPLSWDSDSFVIGIDQHTSAPISNDKRHFIELQESHAKVVGVDGVPRGIAAGKGKLIWFVENDEGVIHKWVIPNAYYIPGCPKCLLPPQFFAKYGNTNKEKTQCLQLWNRTVLKWGSEGQYTKTIWLGRGTAVPDMMSAPSNHSYTQYSNYVDVQADAESFEVSIPNVIEDYDSDTNENVNASFNDNASIIPINRQGEESRREENLTDFMTMKEANQATPNIIEQDQQDPPNTGQYESGQDIDHQMSNDSTHHMKDHQMEGNHIPPMREIEQDKDVPATTDQAELLRWHYRLGHVSFYKLRVMALLNIIPRRLAFVKFPKCQACCYGKQTRRPWRTKSQPRKIKPCTSPGECVSVDQLESSTTGFIAQLKGKLTSRRYKCATVFVDHYSDLTYIHLHSRLTNDETVEAKKAFEAFARNYGVKIQNYHCDNGRFADNAFISECRKSGQTITYCSVDAHFQNGKAEKE